MRLKIQIKELMYEIISCGGDTDTNCSVAGFIYGAINGLEHMIEKLPHKNWLDKKINSYLSVITK